MKRCLILNQVPWRRRAKGQLYAKKSAVATLMGAMGYCRGRGVEIPSGVRRQVPRCGSGGQAETFTAILSQLNPFTVRRVRHACLSTQNVVQKCCGQAVCGTQYIRLTVPWPSPWWPYLRHHACLCRNYSGWSRNGRTEKTSRRFWRRIHTNATAVRRIWVTERTEYSLFHTTLSKDLNISQSIQSICCRLQSLYPATLTVYRWRVSWNRHTWFIS